MRSDKEMKRWFKGEASKAPERFFATRILEERGYKRAACTRCGTFFWSIDERDVCGDASCAGGFTLFENNPCRKAMDYVEIWKEFSRHFEKKGYSVVPRYPVVARWNPTMEFTIASIAAFQPHVVSGEVDPPAPLLVIPQFCLRFGDVGNVGVTMSHNTGFVMIGQHAFVEEWEQERYFRDICDWLSDGLGLPPEEVIFHEDAWAGGGNFGPCMEFFSRGVELGNQVYMMFEQDDEAPNGYRELDRKVLDMGMGHERNAWFSQGKGTIYDATFPTVIAKLKERTGVEHDEALMQRYIPYAAFLNLDEIESLDEAWQRVSTEVGIPATELREKIEPMTALYSVAEHARTLLFALTDGGLPSNVGGGYNLRLLFRRAQRFIESHEWDFDLADVCDWHAAYLKPIFPEVSEHLGDVRKILDVEKRKYRESQRRAGQVIRNEVQKWRLGGDAAPDERVKGEETLGERLIQLYDSHGVQPEDVQRVVKEAFGKHIQIPDNFYGLVAERQEQREQKTQTRKETKLPLDAPKTRILYYDSWDYVDFTSPVVQVLGDKVVLERTAFYPTSGGQEHDIGTLNAIPVKSVWKQDGIIVHELAREVDWTPGTKVEGHIDIERRRQLAQHHTATHIINGAARQVLGDHVWQAGAAKTMGKARIDITHYETLTEEELRAIEREANRVVEANLPVTKRLMPKNLAEAEYGFRLYQGGAVPGKEIRVVDIAGFDTEACGGTHLNLTGEVGTIRLVGSRKVQDGIIRLEYTAGSAAQGVTADEGEQLKAIATFLGVEPKLVPAKAESLFQTWKRLRKAVKKKKPLDAAALQEPPLEPYEGDILTETARRLQTQPEHLLKTLKRFSSEIEEMKQKLDA